jgi:hypothetical protein
LAITTGLDQVFPPLLDFENIIDAVVPPQSPAGPFAVQRCQVTYTVPSLPMAKSLHWSTDGYFCVASTKEVVQVFPLSLEWETAILLLRPDESNCVVEM